MKTFIKIEGHNCWFLQLESGDSYVSPSPLTAFMTTSYADLANKYGTLLIRESGTWMTLLSDSVITETVTANDFPTTHNGDNS